MKTSMAHVDEMVARISTQGHAPFEGTLVELNTLIDRLGLNPDDVNVQVRDLKFTFQGSLFTL